MISALAEATDVQPEILVTVNVYVFGGIPVNVAVVPELFNVNPPGEAVTVQAPAAGKPLKSTLPAGVEQSGCVIVPIIGAVGVVGCAFIMTFDDATEVHPETLVTVNVYVVLSNNPVKVPVVPELFNVKAPGEDVTVQAPAAGKPLKATLPVAVEQVG